MKRHSLPLTLQEFQVEFVCRGPDAHAILTVREASQIGGYDLGLDKSFPSLIVLQPCYVTTVLRSKPSNQNTAWDKRSSEAFHVLGHPTQPDTKAELKHSGCKEQL